MFAVYPALADPTVFSPSASQRYDRRMADGNWVVASTPTEVQVRLSLTDTEALIVKFLASEKVVIETQTPESISGTGGSRFGMRMLGLASTKPLPFAFQFAIGETATATATRVVIEASSDVGRYVFGLVPTVKAAYEEQLASFVHRAQNALSPR